MNVLIVGAGIAGPTLAYWLARAGHRPTLLEHAPGLRRGGYVIDFWGAGFEVADRMGIVPELLRRAYRPREGRQESRDGTCMFSFNPESFFGPGARYVSLARSDLAAVLYGALEGRVETIFDDTVRSLEDDGGCVRVTFANGGAPRDFDLVVGADGLHSRVRRLVFGPDESFEKYLGLKVAAFDLESYRPREEQVVKLYTEVGFQVTSFPIRGDATMFALTFLDKREDLPATREAQEALLRERFATAGWETPAILGQMPRAQSLYVDRVSQIRMPSWTRGRVALLGDAAACPSLLSGQGSALAMVSAYVLAAELSRTPDHADAFAAYERRLAPFLLAKQKAAERLALSFAPKNGFQLFVRNSVMRLMRLQFVAKLAAGTSFTDAIELPPGSERLKGPMPRPRFHKLPLQQQQAILRVALEEFSTQGFNAASLNRIIDEAGISKGSLYYYFDGKDDLYAHVARVELGRLLAAAGPFPVPSAREPDAFWATLTDYYLRIMGALVASPQLAALARGFVAASASPALQQALKEMEAALLPWFEQSLAAGQRARAVRKDVPTSLLITVVFAMGQAMDAWLVTQDVDERKLRKLIAVFIGMLRKALTA